MPRQTINQSVALMMSCLLWTACTEEPATADAATAEDSGGGSADVQTTDQGNTSRDSGGQQQQDAGDLPDLSNYPDAMTLPDAMSLPDVMTYPDAMTLPDVGTVADMGMSVPDASSPRDTGLPDASGPRDTGTVIDGGVEGCFPLGIACTTDADCHGLYCSPLGNICLNTTPNELCGGFVMLGCPSHRPFCMYFAGADAGPCFTAAEQRCICGDPRTRRLFPTCP